MTLITLNKRTLQDIFDKTTQTLLNDLVYCTKVIIDDVLIDKIMRMQTVFIISKLFQENENLRHQSTKELEAHVAHNLIELSRIIEDEIKFRQITREFYHQLE